MNSITDTLKASVISYCSTIGKDPLLVQGAGGNVSWKENDTLWIKASGTWLAQAAEKDIFVPVDLPYLHTAIESCDFSVTPRVVGESALRPSIETLLHALMPHRVVVHLHAIEILAHLVRDNCEPDFQSLLGASVHWTMVGYHKPGAALAAAVSVALAQKPNVDVLFLKNHGVVIGGANIPEVSSILNQLIMDLSTNPISVCNQTLPVLPTELKLHNQYLPIQDTDLHQLALNSDLFNRIYSDWALYPDHVVFLGASPVCYNSMELIIDDLKLSIFPELIFLKGRGVFLKEGFSAAKQAQLKCYYDVMVRQSKYNRLNVLDEKQISDLLNWDAEQYRMAVAK